MDGMRIDVLRAATAALVTFLFVIAPLLGFMYGTSSALTFGSFTLISPLELALVSLSTRTIPVNLIVPGMIAVLVIVFFGRFFCGWICPVGILLEFSHGLTVRRERRGLGGLWLSREKHAILVAVLGASLLFGFSASYLFSPPSVVYRIMLYLAKSGLLGADIIVLLSIFAFDFVATRYDWNWCNSLCPLGAVISSLSIVNLVKPKVNRSLCVDFDFNCLNCSRVCPMRIPIASWWSERRRRWAMMECTKCLKCWASCPVKAINIEIFA